MFDWKAITSSVVAATPPSIRGKGQDDELVSSLPPSPPFSASGSGDSISGVEGREEVVSSACCPSFLMFAFPLACS